MSEPKSPPARAIDLRVDIQSSLEAVWQALATAEGLTNWFPAYASVRPGPGGSITVSFEPGEDWESPIVTWEPHARLGIASDMPTKDGGSVRLVIDYHLEARGGTVTVRLVHSGFDESDSWDDYIDGLTAGWSYFLFNLRHALERHPGVRRVLLSARPKCRGGIDESRARVFGPAGLDVQPDVTTLAAGKECTLRIGESPLRARVALTNLPRTIAFVIPELNDALLFVEREGLQNDHRVGLWLSLYGVDRERVTALERDVQKIGQSLADGAAVGGVR
jgi:uncharacterized protein YndB with AHSA1/START domain